MVAGINFLMTSSRIRLSFLRQETDSEEAEKDKQSLPNCGAVCRAPKGVDSLREESEMEMIHVVGDENVLVKNLNTSENGTQKVVALATTK